MSQVSPESTESTKSNAAQIEHLDAALSHVDGLIQSGHIARGAAKGLVYSLVETLGVLVGDPDLPAHARSGYEGLLESAHELRAKLDQLTE